MPIAKKSVLNDKSITLQDLITYVDVRSDEECWNWLYTLNYAGYGLYSRNYKQYRAHRAIYELLNGKVEPRLEMDHLCRNHSCVNPYHLEPVTTAENQYRGVGIMGQNYRKTHCPAGHEYNNENTYRIGNYGRRCRVCNTIAARKYRSKKHE